MGKIGSRSITIFLLCLCLNQLPILRSEYFSFSYVLKIKCNMHQSLESGSSCSVKRRSTCLLTTINFNLQSGFNGIGCQGSVRHPKGVQSHVDSTFGISNFWCWEVNTLGNRASKDTAICFDLRFPHPPMGVGFRWRELLHAYFYVRSFPICVS